MQAERESSSGPAETPQNAARSESGASFGGGGSSPTHQPRHRPARPPRPTKQTASPSPPLTAKYGAEEVVAQTFPDKVFTNARHEKYTATVVVGSDGLRILRETGDPSTKTISYVFEELLEWKAVSGRSKDNNIQVLYKRTGSNISDVLEFRVEQPTMVVTALDVASSWRATNKSKHRVSENQHIPSEVAGMQTAPLLPSQSPDVALQLASELDSAPEPAVEPEKTVQLQEEVRALRAQLAAAQQLLVFRTAVSTPTPTFLEHQAARRPRAQTLPVRRAYTLSLLECARVPANTCADDGQG